MDSFTTVTYKAEKPVLPPVNEDDSGGSSGSCVVCKEDTSLPTVNEDDSGGSSGSCDYPGTHEPFTPSPWTFITLLDELSE
ncbi:hypothetical protein C8R45DRAFT_1105697 [Mycena sanguinolenta]|nr:hypothetical protein C8R45DRAFT_1105697 [Mycena sanguinolenta]